MAQTYTVHHDPGDPWEGMALDLAGYKDRVRTSRAAFPDQKFEIQQLFADGESVVMSWLWSGTLHNEYSSDELWSGDMLLPSFDERCLSHVQHGGNYLATYSDPHLDRTFQHEEELSGFISMPTELAIDPAQLHSSIPERAEVRP